MDTYISQLGSYSKGINITTIFYIVPPTISHTTETCNVQSQTLDRVQGKCYQCAGGGNTLRTSTILLPWSLTLVSLVSFCPLALTTRHLSCHSCHTPHTCTIGIRRVRSAFSILPQFFLLHACFILCQCIEDMPSIYVYNTHI